MRSKMWLSGRKLSATSPSSTNRIEACTFEAMFRCESITPLGVPVVPEVYRMLSKSFSVAAWHLRTNSASSSADSASPMAGKFFMSIVRRGPTLAACSAEETKTAQEPLGDRRERGKHRFRHASEVPLETDPRRLAQDLPGDTDDG